jgi:putative photosynthetic complex assembly protein 2
MAFLMGFVTGPRASACPVGATGWRRAGFAFETIAYHEIALLVAGALIAATTWNSPNQLGLHSFGVLWISRQSTKLNLFLGVRNLSEEFLPEHLRYLESYFTRRPMNLLFPLSVTAGTWAAALLWHDALSQAGPEPTSIALSFLATLLTLALLEHWFLVAPINVSALWNWSLGDRATERAPVERPRPSDSSLLATALAVDGHTEQELCHSRT